MIEIPIESSNSKTPEIISNTTDNKLLEEVHVPENIHDYEISIDCVINGKNGIDQQ